MRPPTILILGKDEYPGEDPISQYLRRYMIFIRTAVQAQVLQLFRENPPDLVIIRSSRNQPADGLTTIEQIRRIDPLVPIIFITRHSSEERAIAAFRAGANDYFRIPFSHEAFSASVDRCLHNDFLHHQARNGKGQIDWLRKNPMIGDSKPMQEIKNYLQKVAVSDSTVLVTGETGSGKELVADLIHVNSARRDKPFICVNCAALPESLMESELFGYDRGAFTGAVAAKPGKFEMAGGGSVFLDEIGDMNQNAQSKILRSIECKEVSRLGGQTSIPLNMRIIAATNRDPEQLVAAGKFREDLYYRLNVARIHLPPLRERKEDIPQLAKFAIKKLNGRFKRQVQGLSEEAMACLMRYDWPGNVRELMNLMEATFINLPRRQIAFAHLPVQFQKKLRDTRATGSSERNYILSALMAVNWNKSSAAAKLNWSRMTLYRKIAKYNIVEVRHPPR
jgi:DNA-binding NtrC family response regulator